MGIREWLGLGRADAELTSGPQHRSRGSDSYGANLSSGGIRNPGTGMGGRNDKSEGSFFLPTRVYSRTPMEVLYVQSWAARKYIDIPVMDALLKWREWQGDEGDAAVEAMQESEKRHRVKARIAKAWISGRKMGSSLLCMMTTEAPLDTELMPERVREGDLRSLQVFDRFSAYVNKRDHDPMSPTYGEPLEYYVFPRKGSGFYIHASRVLRFDGIAPDTSDGYQIYDYDWGVSLFVPAILAIQQDQALATAASHLAQVASIPVLAVEGLREAAAGLAGSNEVSAEDVGIQVNEMMSIFRLLMIDKGSEDFTRVAVQFGGLDKIQERMERRLAAAGSIPITRFWGSSPGGLNATGDSDWDNYAQMVDAERSDKLEDIDRLDQVLARDAGLPEPPECEWRSLMEAGDQDVALAAKTKLEALKAASEAGYIDEDEGRDAIDGDPVFGPLPGPAPEPEPEPMPGMVPGGSPFAPKGSPPSGAGKGPPN